MPGTTGVPSPGDHAPDLQLLLAKEESGNVSLGGILGLQQFLGLHGTHFRSNVLHFMVEPQGAEILAATAEI